MNDRRREHSIETYWPLRLVKRAVRLAKAKAYADVLDTLQRGDGDGVELTKAHARRRVRECREGAAK